MGTVTLCPPSDYLVNGHRTDTLISVFSNGGLCKKRIVFIQIKY